MFARISTGWNLAMQSWGVLSKDKELMVFPLLSGIACLLVLASFALPLWGLGGLELLGDEHQQRQITQNPLAYVVLFAFYFVNYLVIVYFNAALISCAIIRFHGGDPTLADGFRAASARMPQIVGWALVSATVGVILRVIESQSEKVGQIVAGLLGMAWGIMTYFVVPVLVVEKVGPIDAVRRSTSIMKKTWGESLAANIGIGPIIFVALLLAALPAILGVASGTPVGMIAGIAVSVVLWIGISLASAALQAIVLAALYLYASEGRTSADFDAGVLEQAFKHK